MAAGANGRAPGWMTFAAVSALVLATAGVVRLAAPAPQPVVQVRHVRLPPDAPRTYDQTLAKLDGDIARARLRAAAHANEWTVLEALARRYAARARLTGSFDDHARAQSTLDQAFAVARPGTGPHLTQAVLHFTMHRLAGAERQLAIMDRYAVRPDAEERAEMAAMRGDIAFYRGDYGGALAGYARAEAIEPGAGTAFRRAVHAAKMGRLAAAADYFDSAVRASRMPTPQFRANVELQKGALRLEQGRWDEALVFFRRADAIFPGHWLFAEHIAETLALKGETRAAEAMYVDIVRQTNGPEFMDALADLALRRGDAAGAAAWRARAGAIWEARLRQFPEAAYGHALSHFVAAGDRARALEIARANAAARPYGDAQAALAEALLQAGQPEAARDLIAGVLKSGWSTSQAHAVAAQAYAATGSPIQAALERARALAINPHELDNPALPAGPFS